MRFYIVFFIAILLDQVSKIWVRLHLPTGDSLEIWTGILHFTHYENSGAASSMFQGYGRLFVPVAILAVVFVLYFRRKGHLNRWLLDVGAALFAGGAIGNAIDRVLFNQVTDFIVFQSSNGIMNVADLVLNLAILLLGLDQLLKYWRNRRTRYYHKI
ncbi:hypothetical protein Back11_13580 [Paenibacillus baekrokdamisoli]|uniref:Lipoprotein signal peptidase n=1 Tax=Paenibacillus baekrokdamisoli TaxID=1712516 RepID=A0A3G9J5F8_9BACL|nr:signal peptidase II [Paenibacillus baekrokdamisoli]MBB3070663.1 signal peptidase II [Paenibacillus baekrokdamisoli]BBH20013.1 hypothetical protein Back11_13580 [Paenibacillus baekrokdamisoli]